jgi:CHASE3 domain sensor protein
MNELREELRVTETCIKSTEKDVRGYELRESLQNKVGEVMAYNSAANKLVEDIEKVLLGNQDYKKIFGIKQSLLSFKAEVGSKAIVLEFQRKFKDVCAAFDKDEREAKRTSSIQKL